MPGTKAFRTSSNCAIIVAREPVGPGGAMRWHLSISHHNRYPHWDEIHEARYELIPNEAMMAMILPPREEYVNLHARCFHLYEIEAGEVANRIVT
jgi:hypothetical protein